MMHAFIQVFRRETEYLQSNIFLTAALFIVPLFFVTIVVLTFSSGTARDLPVAVLNADNSSLSRQLVRYIDATPSAAVKYKITNLHEGQKLLESGKIYALTVIPEDFRKDLNNLRRPDLVYYYNNQMIAVAGILSRDMKTAVAAFTAGVSAEFLRKQGLPESYVSGQINAVRTDERVKSNPYFNYSYFLVYTAIAHIFQIIAALTAVWTAGIEFKNGTAKEWLDTAGGSVTAAVTGKLLPYFILLFLLQCFCYAAYVFVCTAPFYGSLLFSTAGIACFLGAYQLAGIFFVALLANLREALSVGAVYTSLGFSLAGMTFPASGMPPYVLVYSSFLAVRPFTALITDQALKALPPVYDLKYIFWMLALCCTGVCSFPLLKKQAENKQKWYQI